MHSRWLHIELAVAIPKIKYPKKSSPIYKIFAFFNLQVMLVCKRAKFLVSQTALLSRATKSEEKLVQVSVKKI